MMQGVLAASGQSINEQEQIFSENFGSPIDIKSQN